MIIRSQDKKNTTDDLNLYIDDYNQEGYSICNSKMNNLGAYSTEEKAIKVLDMIQEAYARYESTRELASGILLEFAKRFSNEQAEEFKKEHRTNFVFQMPQDEEVEV